MRRAPFVKKKPARPGGTGLMVAVALLGMAVIVHPDSASGQSMEPRAYSNAPVGMNFLILGYAYQEGDVLLDPSASGERCHC